MSEIISGKLLAQERLNKLSSFVPYVLASGIVPKLAIVASPVVDATLVYIKNKMEAARQIGIDSVLHTVSPSSSQEEAESIISSLNADESVCGIIVQLPLPSHFDKLRLINLVLPDKDVDGFNYLNQGKLFSGNFQDFFCISATATSIVWAIRNAGLDTIVGKHVLVVGNSIVVGMPASVLLSRIGLTVTIANSKTVELEKLSTIADILVVATGKPNLITDSMVHSGSVVIDVGISKVDGKIVGDVDFSSVSKVVRAITPVPGGIGPLTIAFLLQNVVCVSAIKAGLKDEVMSLWNDIVSF